MSGVVVLKGRIFVSRAEDGSASVNYDYPFQERDSGLIALRVLHFDILLRLRYDGLVSLKGSLGMEESKRSLRVTLLRWMLSQDTEGEVKS